ncbi:Uncharacterized protein HZ326_31012 [Fusarium oxysporum f. sp. albedinis]|nr:Uncharacterized protein HZ326_31012 [Fusarium oxysporum f. sp. albedinis]
MLSMLLASSLKSTLALQMPRLHNAVRLPCTLRTNLHTSSWNGVTTSSGSVRRREWYGRCTHSTRKQLPKRAR